jgi:hypothetical protein
MDFNFSQVVNQPSIAHVRSKGKRPGEIHTLVAAMFVQTLLVLQFCLIFLTPQIFKTRLKITQVFLTLIQLQLIFFEALTYLLALGSYHHLPDISIACANMNSNVLCWVCEHFSSVRTTFSHFSQCSSMTFRFVLMSATFSARIFSSSLIDLMTRGVDFLWR